VCCANFCSSKQNFKKTPQKRKKKREIKSNVRIEPKDRPNYYCHEDELNIIGITYLILTGVISCFRGKQPVTPERSILPDDLF